MPFNSLPKANIFRLDKGNELLRGLIERDLHSQLVYLRDDGRVVHRESNCSDEAGDVIIRCAGGDENTHPGSVRNARDAALEQSGHVRILRHSGRMSHG